MLTITASICEQDYQTQFSFRKAKKVLELLKNYDIRVLVDDRNEKIGKKIRDTELNKVPFMLIVGEKEAEENKISVRKQSVGDLGSFSVEEFAALINKEIEIIA